METNHLQIKEAFFQGAKAFSKGVLPWENPYDREEETKLWNAWEGGFKSESDKQDKKINELCKPWWCHRDVIISFLGLILSIISLAFSIFVLFYTWK